MTCSEFLEILQQHFDSASPIGETVFECHVHECATCAARLRAARKLTEGLRLLSPPAPAPELSRRITAAARTSLRRRRLVRRMAFVGAVAAGFLIVITLRSNSPAPGPVVIEPEAANTPSIDAVTPFPEQKSAKAPLRNTLTEAGNAVASLTTRTADEAIDQTRLLLPDLSRPTLGGLELLPPRSSDPLLEVGQNITAGLDPVTTSARRAVDLFLRDIPPVGAPERKGL